MKNFYNNGVKGLSVNVKEGAYAFDRALKKFKKKVEEDGRLREAKDRSEYIGASEQRRIARKKAKSRYNKKLRDERKALERYNR